MLRIAVLESIVHDRQQPGTAVGTRRELMEKAEGAQVRFLKQIFRLLLGSCQVEAGGVNVVFVRERPLLEQDILVLPTRFLRGHVQTGTTNPARVPIPGKRKQEGVEESSQRSGFIAE